MNRIRFASGIAGFRIIRTTLELFLVLRMQELGFAMSKAGIVYLLFGVSSVFTGVFFILWPSFCFGSKCKASIFILWSLASMVAGLIAVFRVESIAAIISWAVVCGVGSTAWKINFEALTVSFPTEYLESIAFHRQLFECLAFLLPSICMAVVFSIEADAELVSLSTTILGVIAALFSFLSMDQVVGSASNITPGDEEKDIIETGTTIAKAFKDFFFTSVVKYCFLNAGITAIGILVVGTLPITTENYFGLDPALFWIGAMAFPIGGMAIIFDRRIKKSGIDRSTNDLRVGCIAVAVVCMLPIAATPLFPPINEKLAKTSMFFFCFVAGLVYSFAINSAKALWLLILKNYDVSFVTRANVIESLANQMIGAILFQLHTLLLDAVLRRDNETNDLVWAESCAFFLPPLCSAIVLVWIIMCLKNASSDEATDEETSSRLPASNSLRQKSDRPAQTAELDAIINL